MDYHAAKNKIWNFVKSIGSKDGNITQLLEKIDDKQYSNSGEVINATGLVKRQ